MKILIKKELKNDKERLKYLISQVRWAVNHYGVVSVDGIMGHLRDSMDVCDLSNGEEKLQKVITGEFSITDHKKGKIWIMKETGEHAGEGSEFSKGFFDKFLSDFFDKYM